MFPDFLNRIQCHIKNLEHLKSALPAMLFLLLHQSMYSAISAWLDHFQPSEKTVSSGTSVRLSNSSL